MRPAGITALSLSGNVVDMAETIGPGATTFTVIPRMFTFRGFFNLLGMKELQEAEARYGVPEEKRVRYSARSLFHFGGAESRGRVDEHG